jgi:hypothetical protein
MRPSNSRFGIVFHIEELTDDLHAGPTEQAALLDRAHNAMAAEVNYDPSGFDPDDLYEFDELDENFGRVAGVFRDDEFVADPECDHITDRELLFV